MGKLDHLVIPEAWFHALTYFSCEGRQSSPTAVPARSERLPASLASAPDLAS